MSPPQPGQAQRAREPDALDRLLAPINPGAAGEGDGQEATTIAEEGPLPCLLPLCFFLLLLGGVGAYVHWQSTGLVNLPVLVLYSSVVTTVAVGAVIYTYLKHANELHDEEQAQRVERFRHYSHHRLYQSTEVHVPAVPSDGLATGIPVPPQLYGACQTSRAKKESGMIYTATVSPHPFVLRKENGAYGMVPHTGLVLTGPGGMYRESTGLSRGATPEPELPPVLTLQGIPAYEPGPAEAAMGAMPQRGGAHVIGVAVPADAPRLGESAPLIGGRGGGGAAGGDRGDGGRSWRGAGAAGRRPPPHGARRLGASPVGEPRPHTRAAVAHALGDPVGAAWGTQLWGTQLLHWAKQLCATGVGAGGQQHTTGAGLGGFYPRGAAAAHRRTAYGYARLCAGRRLAATPCGGGTAAIPQYRTNCRGARAGARVKGQAPRTPPLLQRRGGTG